MNPNTFSKPIRPSSSRSSLEFWLESIPRVKRRQRPCVRLENREAARWKGTIFKRRGSQLVWVAVHAFWLQGSASRDYNSKIDGARRRCSLVVAALRATNSLRYHRSFLISSTVNLWGVGCAARPPTRVYTEW